MRKANWKTPRPHCPVSVSHAVHFKSRIEGEHSWLWLSFPFEVLLHAQPPVEVLQPPFPCFLTSREIVFAFFVHLHELLLVWHWFYVADPCQIPAKDGVIHILLWNIVFMWTRELSVWRDEKRHAERVNYDTMTVWCSFWNCLTNLTRRVVPPIVTT